MDVWFDSGSSWNGCLRERGTTYPSDLYLEGSDQYRGWFNSSLIVSVACNHVAPYKSVVSHGWVLDEHGEQMHKSKGNGVDPTKIANVYGADILRLWTASIDYQQDVRIGENLIKQVAEQYRKIRNTLKFISWNLKDFDVNKEAKEFSLIDQYILAKLNKLIRICRNSFDKYDFSSATSEIFNFCSSDLSSFYLDISKDVLYCDDVNSKRRNQTQTVLYKVGEALLRILNPILPFTMDEFNKNMPGKRVDNVQYLDYPTYEEKDDEELLKQYELILSLRSDVLKALEESRNQKVIGSAQEALVSLEITDESVKEVADKLSLEELATLFVVSEVVLESNPNQKEFEHSKVEIKHHDGKFCERCWNYSKFALVQEDGTYLCPRCQKVIHE